MGLLRRRALDLTARPSHDLRTLLPRNWLCLGRRALRWAAVERRLALAYVQDGTIAGLAAVIFVSRVTEARANAGTGYELAAITAVVFGGTSIFGGTGSVHGTLLRVAAVNVLANGLSRILSIMPFSRELSGILTGALLPLALAAGALMEALSLRRARKSPPGVSSS